jgi:uncharacterized protein DUF4054
MTFAPGDGSVVVFNYPAWLVAYPAFGNVPIGQAQEFFNRACTLCDNTATSPIPNSAPTFLRTLMLNAATAHFAYLFTPDAAGNVRPVGRMSAAAEGSVSLSLDYVTPQTATAAFWNQTQYGAYFWAASLPYRSFRYIPGIRTVAGVGGFFPGRRRGFF